MIFDEIIKLLGDVTAYSITVGVILNWIPYTVGILSIAWFVHQIYDWWVYKRPINKIILKELRDKHKHDG